MKLKYLFLITAILSTISGIDEYCWQCTPSNYDFFPDQEYFYCSVNPQNELNNKPYFTQNNTKWSCQLFNDPDKCKNVCSLDSH